ncbi:zinc ABC transporter substrate-binding protein [Frankia sp. AgB1.9]|uniref:metal ABC transporter solute-binding protein, Zn/Mn family n=1 Tax=unclassified Frankia TaxID=2632575 RepID=UPI0019320140|nr:MULTISPECIES: zinc ABC transporter substrate-binding protein [unclassified Frankia]MBL7487532.1 zinc ABC transporter substrate-binding protein [Frankia sp. AgW1.1]MBL7549503.1 zinc ABC transporter substrate-binding protein [Frankia sp. AgB1.9]MBL7620708.1 zinc ABC transporter substrate-binding protein [Frankia sp. AgB1.8]
MSSVLPSGAAPGRLARRVVGAAALVALVLAGCSTSSGDKGSGASAAPGVINVVAAENFWGSLAAQLGGSHVKVTSIIDNPDADPHDYEPTAADGRAIAAARLAIINGVGYDAWATKLADANPSASRTTLTVGDLVGAKDGDNPHRWYNPDNVRTVIDAITAAYKKTDPADAAFFDTQRTTVLTTNLKTYFDTITAIKTTYAGTPVDASESIFAMVSPALGLNLLTPPAFLTAISEGTDPTPADKATIDTQIAGKQIKVYVYNSQNATPDVQEQVDAAKAQGIPVTTITETLTPAGASFQDWQVAQLQALQKALAAGTGK